ncbi:MAG: signal recognition particle subunit SRP19/SEC65 family protein [Candidatus Bathyarchaeia archaeon]
MRRKKNVIIWPAYFDSSLTRSRGRRVTKAIAISDPTAKKVKEAAESIGLDPVIEPGCSHPALPWKKIGRILVEKKTSKMQTVAEIARRLQQHPRRKK